MIPVYIESGLLDSGKTSFIQSTLLEQDWIAKGTTLLILCEEGEYELPESYKKSKRIAEIPVSSPDSFTESYCSELTKKLQPAQIIIEFNGMWDLKAFLQKDLLPAERRPKRQDILRLPCFRRYN